MGACSWSDRSLVASGFYPRRTMRAAERLAYYASIFPLAEVGSTYYFPPTEETAGLWVTRTPPGFTFSVRAYSLFTGHPTRPDSLWPEVAERIPIEHRHKHRIYLSHLPAAAVDDAWELFRLALMPLHSAGKLGTVTFQFPHWFRPSPVNRAALRELGGRLPDFDLAVEFRHPSWLEEGERDATLELLEDEGLTFVCVDEAQRDGCVPRVVAATADLAVVRLWGRSTAEWDPAADMSAAERFAYRYPTHELAGWVPSLRLLAETARETHVLLANCWRDDAVANGRELAGLLGTGLMPGAPPG